MYLEGIDVSFYQGMVNWRAVKRAGKSFAIIKASEAATITDPQLDSNWRIAHAVGLPRIAYHFWYDNVAPKLQVERLHQSVRNAGHFLHGDGVAIDVEEVSITEPSISFDNLLTTVELIRHDIAKEILIYTNYDTWVNMLGNPTHEALNDVALWLGNWSFNVPSLKQWPGGPAIMQYSGHGHCPGVDGEVDLDRFYGSMHQLRKLLHGL